MSYQVLARKWRPHSFKDMVGQEHILRMLFNALEQKRLHHAYLFTGTRGVGKTTIARILAKCLNCDTGVTPLPCDACKTCLAIDAGQFLDLFEVDAASRTKVEDTRELLDNVLYPPTQGRYKIYLIDEVHMLSNHSFNALLKTLEEPPEHVKFLLATTDPKRLPITILSRCLQFHLKRITPEQIAKHLEHICHAETIAHDVPALERLAKAADGSMRDALSLLDQAIAYGQNRVDATEVNAMLGSMAQEDLLPLLQSLAAQDGQVLFANIATLAENAPDFQQLLEEIISLFHQIAILQITKHGASDNELVQTLAKQFTPEEVQLYYQIALLGRRDLSFTPSPQQGFEMTMLRMLAFKPQAASAQPIAQVNTKQNLAPVNKVSLQPTPQKISAKSIAQSIAVENDISTASQEIMQSIDTSSLPDWREIVNKLGLTGMGQALAANCVLKKMEGDKIELALSTAHQPMLNPKLKERLTEALGTYFNKLIHLDIQVTTDELATPSRQHQQEQSTKLSQAKETVLQDPLVQKLVEMYDATVEVSLLAE